MREKNYFFSGITELLILAILSHHDSYAYEITKFIKEASNDTLDISQNTIYAITYKMEEEGKISQYSKLVGKRRTRMYCHIEDIGKEHYEKLLNNFRIAFNGVEKIISSLSLLNEEDIIDE